jgi:hypothetical protein
VHQAPASTPEPTVAAPASTTTAAAPVDPYEALPTPAATTSSSDVRAFPSTPAGAIREAETPVGDRALSPFADPGTATTPAPTPAPAPTTAPTTAPTPPATSPEPPKAPVQLPRADLTAALADFAALSQALRAHLTAQGAQLDAVAPTGLFQRLGLRPGDVVLAVDNLALRDLDAVAELYARAATVKAFRIQLLRAGAPVTLDIIIR